MAAGDATASRALPDDPDFGLLFQDPPGTQERIDALGPYARQVTVPDAAAYAAFAHLARDD